MAQQGFWSSLSGILTGLAAVITAITGLYIAIQTGGQSSEQAQADTTVQTEQIGSNKERPVVNDPPVVKQPNVQIKTPIQTTIKKPELLQKAPQVAQLNLKTLVNCDAFPTVNTVRSLMSWSNHYHQKIEAAGASKQRALEPCKKAINYRAQAHCKVPDNTEVRQGLFETLSLCKAAGIRWQDVKPN